VLFIIGFIYILLHWKNIWLMGFMIFSLISKTILIYVHYHIRPVFLSSDQYVFLEKAIEWSSEGLMGTFQYLNVSESYVFSWFASVVFSIVGVVPEAVSLISVLLMIVLIKLVYDTSYIVSRGSVKVSLFCSFLISAIPSISILSAVFLRDSIVVFFVSAFFYNMVVWIYEKKNIYAFFSVISLSLAGMFHGAFLILFPVVFCIGLFYLLFEKISIYKKLMLIFILMLVPVIGILGAGFASGNSKVQVIYSLIEQDESVLNTYKTSRQESSDVYTPYPVINDTRLLGMIYHLPLRVWYFVSKPDLTLIKKITDIPRVLDSYLFVVVLLAVIYSLANKKRFDKRVFLFLCILIFLFIMFAFGSHDVATAQRHRIKFIPSLVSILGVYVLSVRYKLRFK
jgi:hypothetical protein